MVVFKPVRRQKPRRTPIDTVQKLRETDLPQIEIWNKQLKKIDEDLSRLLGEVDEKKFGRKSK